MRFRLRRVTVGLEREESRRVAPTNRGMKQRALYPFLLAAALLAACGGGGGGSSVPQGVGAVATTPPVSAGTSAFSVSNAVPIPAPAPGASSIDIALPSDPSTGAAATTTFPGTGAVPTDTAIDATYASTGDASLPTISSTVRAPQDGGSVTVSITAASPTPPIPAIAFLRLRFSATVSLPQTPGFTFVVPGTLPTTGLTYWLALLDPLRDAASWQKNFEGPATVTPITVLGNRPATKLVFASNGQPLTFQANETYWLAIIAINTATGNPTPVPSSVPPNP
ncbi:MAG: hypothetical protein JOZ24_02580, partial [Candidatus Eremiobacteraeota bacterium]|nr:hypothetical protein [Candidatus Eremiobacteraeota bacterium]